MWGNSVVAPHEPEVLLLIFSFILSSSTLHYWVFNVRSKLIISYRLAYPDYQNIPWVLALTLICVLFFIYVSGCSMFARSHASLIYLLPIACCLVVLSLLSFPCWFSSQTTLSLLLWVWIPYNLLSVACWSLFSFLCAVPLILSFPLGILLILDSLCW